jgi:putative ubiquitin-RnfH superfamily antitoxin RatB of RatAB toxin-antitoxin module
MMRVTLVSAWADRVEERAIELADGATLGNALVAYGFAEPAQADVGVWGKSVPLDTPLKDGDRIEHYRPLIADPKLARHRRANEQGYRWQGRTRRVAKAKQATESSA